MSRQACIVTKVCKPLLPSQYFRRRITCCRHRFWQELTIFFLGKLGVFEGEHFCDHIQGELSAVSQGHSKMVSQTMKGAELGRQIGRLAYSVHCAAIFAQTTIFTGEYIGTVGKTFFLPCQLARMTSSATLLSPMETDLPPLESRMRISFI